MDHVSILSCSNDLGCLLFSEWASMQLRSRKKGSGSSVQLEASSRCTFGLSVFYELIVSAPELVSVILDVSSMKVACVFIQLH